MRISKITDKIAYLPASETPLSADVGIIRCDDGLWIFDVGSSDEAAAAVNALEVSKNIVLSHFHPDHTGNIERVTYDAIYAGAFTSRRLGVGTEVTGHLYLNNGIHLFPIPSSHAKGCVGLEYGDYAFLGDATYSTTKSGQIVYNAGVLKETIAALKALLANWLLLSHGEPFVRAKSDVVVQLEEIYALRDRQNPYILVTK